MALSFVFSQNFLRGLLLLMLLSFTSCGVKGPVKPPRAQVPESPQNLALRQIGSYFVISWTIPKTNQDGSPLQDLQGFDVYKTRYEPEAACPGCNESGEVFRHIDLEYLRQAFREEDRVFFLDSNLEPNFSYLYRIVPFTSKGQTGASATINREFLIPPPAPTGLHAAIGDQAVNLTWSARAEETAENGFLGYNIYRNEKSEPFPLTPLNEDYWAATSYTDRALPDTDTLSYTVRSVWRRQGLVIESPDSEPVTVKISETD